MSLYHNKKIKYIQVAKVCHSQHTSTRQVWEPHIHSHQVCVTHTVTHAVRVGATKSLTSARKPHFHSHQVWVTYSLSAPVCVTHRVPHNRCVATEPLKTWWDQTVTQNRVRRQSLNCVSYLQRLKNYSHLSMCYSYRRVNNEPNLKLQSITNNLQMFEKCITFTAEDNRDILYGITSSKFKINIIYFLTHFNNLKMYSLTSN